MPTISLIVPATAEVEIRERVRELARAYGVQGQTAEVLEGGALRALLHLLRHSADIVDIHSALLAWIVIPLRLGKRAIIVCTLHQREEFSPSSSFRKRMLARIGVWTAVQYAHEFITTQKSLQYVYFQQYGRLPTFVPQSILLLRDARGTTAHRGTRKHAYVVLITNDIGGRAPLRVRVQRSLAAARFRRRVISLNAADVTYGESRTLLARAAAIIVLHPLLFPGTLRTLAGYGRPLLILDTPEHREALHGRAYFFPGASSKGIRAGIEEFAKRRSLYERLALGNAQRMERLYSADSVAREHLKAYWRSDLQPIFVDSLTSKATT